MSDTGRTQLAIIGGGPGGYAAAFRAADLGLTVTMIDVRPAPGGACLHTGCIPSKALLHVADVLRQAREAAYWGVSYSEPSIDFSRMRAAKLEVINRMTGGLGQLVLARKIRYIQGRASFRDSDQLHVTREDGCEETVAFDNAIIATGARPATLPGVYLESPRLMTSTNALDLDNIPANLLVVGGSYIGVELGSVYAAFGCKVSFAVRGDQILPGVDSDLAGVLAKSMERTLEAIHFDTTIEQIEETPAGLRVRMSSPGAASWQGEYEKALVCIGRNPNASGINLKAVKAEVDKEGFIVTDTRCRTEDPHIFAVGDVTGEPMLAHKAVHQGRVAAEAIAGMDSVFEPAAIPAVVFTNPELAWTGLTEAGAKAQNLDVKIARFPWTASGRASTLHQSEGLTKIITEAGTGRMLGVCIAGAGAGELISQGTLAIELGATAQDIQLTVHPHPSLSETVMETAELIFGRSTHVHATPAGEAAPT